MVPKVKITKTSEIKFILQDFAKECISPNNKLYCDLCSYMLSFNKSFFVEKSSHQKALHSRSDLPISLALQAF